MRTRREILLGGVASLAVPFVGRCSPIKSMLAAEKNFREDEYSPFEIPYITDGLLAMWDGEWNTGLGEHDEEAIIWKDISNNGFDFVLPENGASWRENNLLLSNVSLHTALPPVSRDNFTIECVAECTGGTGAIVWLKNPTWIGGALVGWQTRARCYFPWKEIGDIGDRSLHSISLSWSPTGQFLMVDGVVISRLQGTLDNRRILSDLYIGEYNGGLCYNLTGYSFRLYAKSLTEEESYFNYAIDKERFSL